MSAPYDQPTQEELEAYLAQLREAPVRDLLLQALQMLSTGAEVKLGRPDARVLIDAMDALARVAGDSLGPDAERAAQAVGQLKMMQVQAEQQMGTEAPPQDEPQAQPQPQPQAAPGQKATDKLWIPGRS